VPSKSRDNPIRLGSYSNQAHRGTLSPSSLLLRFFLSIQTLLAASPSRSHSCRQPIHNSTSVLTLIPVNLLIRSPHFIASGLPNTGVIAIPRTNYIFLADSLLLLQLIFIIQLHRCRSLSPALRVTPQEQRKPRRSLLTCRLSPVASRLSPLACRLLPVASHLAAHCMSLASNAVVDTHIVCHLPVAYRSAGWSLGGPQAQHPYTMDTSKRTVRKVPTMAPLETSPSQLWAGHSLELGRSFTTRMS